jgi:hypothetical protein
VVIVPVVDHVKSPVCDELVSIIFTFSRRLDHVKKTTPNHTPAVIEDRIFALILCLCKVLFYKN